MDLDYDISTMKFPLQTLCAITVAYQVLQGSGRIPADKPGQDAVNNVAIDRVRKLGLPKLIEDMIEKLILPISAELHYWYHQLGLDGYPILTPQGTVDVFRSTKIIAEDQKEDRIFRFIVACTFCHEQQIFEIVKQLNTDEIATIKTWNYDPNSRNNQRMEDWKLLTKLWLDAYSDPNNGLTESIISSRDLPLETCDRGFKIAMNCRNEVAMKYFIDQGSPEQIKMIIARSTDTSIHGYRYSPSICCMLFSRLMEFQQRDGRHHAKKLFLELTNWPYQRFFLPAALSLSDDLAAISGSWLLEHFVRKVSYGWKDYDYPELATKLWDLLGDLSKDDVNRVVYYVLNYCKDERMIVFILAKIPKDDKEQLLMSFVQNQKCTSVFMEKDFWFFKIIVRGFGMHSKDLLVKFKELFDAHYTYYYTAGVHDERNADVKRFVLIVDEIIAEKDASDASET